MGIFGGIVNGEKNNILSPRPIHPLKNILFTVLIPGGLPRIMVQVITFHISIQSLFFRIYLCPEDGGSKFLQNVSNSVTLHGVASQEALI
jgi:hypothetical protein